MQRRIAHQNPEGFWFRTEATPVNVIFDQVSGFRLPDERDVSSSSGSRAPASHGHYWQNGRRHRLLERRLGNQQLEFFGDEAVTVWIRMDISFFEVLG